ncbi:MAG: ABC transporter permease subunit [Burkholderiales bacterium]|nr:ABC transporter permease subunit [Burkholderiales bacterium]
MAWLRLDPLTRRRLQRFRSIRRGWIAFLILGAAIGLAVFAPYLAESRALLVWTQGRLLLPTFDYHPMSAFGQAPPPGWSADQIEADYFRLQREWQLQHRLYAQGAAAAGGDAKALAALAARYPHHGDFVVMPPIPWNPYQSDFWSAEVLGDLQQSLDAGHPAAAEARARRDGLDSLADAIRDGRVAALLADPARAGERSLAALARAGALPLPPGIGALPPTPPDALRRHWLGTDSQGRDVAARLLYGFRISIFFALFLVLTGQVIGTVIGSLQGYLGGAFDIVSQRGIEILVAIPFLYVVIVLAALFQPSFWLLVAIMAAFQWISITFYMRTEMYREKTREYCLAARSYGASHWRIVFRHLLPNCLTPLVTFTPFAVVGAIFALTGLDYLGYGLPPPTPSWGELMSQALESGNRGKLWLTLAPFGALTATLVLVVFIGESVREAFDPKPYARYE